MLGHTDYRKREEGRAVPGHILRVTLAFVLFLSPFLSLVSRQADAALPEPVYVATGNMPNAIAVNERTNKIYISNNNSNNVTVIDGATNAVLKTISVGDSPSAMALDRTRNIVYVANYFDASVSVIDGATDTVTATISVSGAPNRLAVDSATHTVYVGHYADDSVKVIDGDTESVAKTLQISGTISAIAVNEGTNKAYVASNDGKVTVIGADRQTTVVAVGNKPVAIGVNQTANAIYVAIDKSGNGEIKAIDGATDAVTATLGTGSGPTAVAINEATNSIYVTNQGSASLTVIDGATNAVSTAALAAGSGPVAAAVDPGANMIYVAHNSSSSMSAVAGGTLAVSTTAAASASQVIAVNAETHKVYLLNASGKKVAVFYTLEDTTPPAVSFQENGSAVPSPVASSTVTVTDMESGVREGWLSYAWSQNESEPDSDYWSFANGSDLDLNADNPNGAYYLYIKASDMAGNSTTVRSNAFLLDSAAPTLTITGAAGETVNGPFPVSIAFSEGVSGFDEDDIEVSNGILSDFAAVDAMRYTAIVTPTTSGQPVTIQIAADAAEDAAGNQSLASSAYSVLYDTTKPTVALGGFTADERFSAAPASFTVTASEALYRLSDSAAIAAGDAPQLIGMTKDGEPFAAYTIGYDEDSLTYTVTFDGTLEDGDYTAAVAGGIAKNRRGNTLDAVSTGFTVAVPVVSGMSVDPAAVSSVGGSVHVTVSGRHLTGQTVTVHRDGEEAATAEVKAPESAEAVVAIPANATTGDWSHRLTVFLNGTEVAGVSETVTARRDAVLPAVHFGANGSTVPSPSARTAVAVDDGESGVDAHSLCYAWTPTDAVPADGWHAFASGDTLTKDGADGEWYLHVRAKDNAGNAADAVSNVFLLDNTGPSVDVAMTKADSEPYPDNVWSNQDVAVSAEATDENSVTAVTYSLDSGAAWDAYTEPLMFQEESVHSVWIKAVDTAGNETIEKRTVKISRSGLRLTPALTEAGGGAYTSGDWTNGSVAASVHAEAGASGIADLTYSLDGGPEQAYTNKAPVTLDQEGAHTLLFKVTDTAGNSMTAPLAVNIDKTAPILALVGPSSVRLKVGDAYTDEGATATDAGGSGVAAPAAATGTVNTAVPGTYALTYNVFDRAGNAAAAVVRTVIVERKYAAPADNGAAPAATKPVIDLGGASLDPADIDPSKPSVTLEATPKGGSAYVGIPASVLTSLADLNTAFLIEIKTPYGSYQVPVNLASLIPGLEELMERLSLKADDIGFKITLTDKSGDKALQAALAADLPNGKVMGAMVDYHIDIVDTRTGQTIGAAAEFSEALTRMIPLPGDVTALPALWGAFRYNETAKTFEFVPATSVQIDGIWYLMIDSYSNSTYVVAENAASFGDMQRHWAQSLVGLAAAKGLVEGVGGGRYAPDKAVTRAEFTTMLVRALGRGSSSAGGTASYRDVAAGAWYAGAVAAAKELGLPVFAQGGDFKPEQPLTREEMAGMLAAAVRLEKPPIPADLASLDGYKDIGSADDSYLEAIRLMAKLGIMTGTGADTFSPQGETTRAQAAVVFIRMLRQLGMIDQEN